MLLGECTRLVGLGGARSSRLMGGRSELGAAMLAPVFVDKGGFREESEANQRNNWAMQSSQSSVSLLSAMA